MAHIGTNPIAWPNDDDPSLGGHIPLEQCLHEAAAIGFAGIEKGHKMPTDTAALRAALAPHGLALVSGWYSLNLLARSAADEIKAITPHLDLLIAHGCTVCIVCETSNSVHGATGIPLTDRPVLAKARWPCFAAAVDTVATHCAARGIHLVYHHHMGTVVQTEAEVRRLMALTGEHTGLLLDTGHATLAGANPTALAQDFTGRLGHIHFKNVRQQMVEQVHEKSFLAAVRAGIFTVPGDEQGVVDIEPVLQAAHGAGYDGWFIVEAEQDPAVHNPYTYQQLGYRTLRQAALAAGFDLTPP